jgi:hypothetical protein
VPESQINEKTRDPPFDGGYGRGARRAQHRIERISPEDRRPLRTPEPEEGKTTPADITQERVRRKRLLIAAVAGALLLIGAIGLAWYWYTTWRWLESTDDAYTQADNTAIVPRVSGYISELVVTDNQRVKAGEVLVRIDPCDYRRRSIRRRPM